MEGYVKAAVLENQFEAELVAAILRERGVPHLIKSYYDIAYDGLFQLQRGWGAVFAPAGYGSEIRTLIDGLRSQAEDGQQ